MQVQQSLLIPSLVMAVSSTWTVDIAVPTDVTVLTASRGSDPGYGVNLEIDEAAHLVRAKVWDTDGDAFFELSRQESQCRVRVGSDGQDPGLRLEVFQQSGMFCDFLVSGGQDRYAAAMLVQLDVEADCDTDEAHQSQSKPACAEGWRAPLLQAPKAGLWEVHLRLPSGVVASRTSRVSDSGYGADLDVTPETVDVSVWDTDGDAFFELTRGGASCKIDVGSNGLDPALRVEVFKQSGLQCHLQAAGGPVQYTLDVAMSDDLTGSADCETDQADRTKSERPCAQAWVARHAVQV
jgi:hypothetical protein